MAERANRCVQEQLCLNWSGDGRVCLCALLDIEGDERPSRRTTVAETGAFVPRPISFERWSEMMREVAPTITDQQLRVFWDDAQQWGEAMRQTTAKPEDRP